MNTKTKLGISLAAIFVLSAVLIPAYAVGHLAIDKTEVKVKTDFVKGKETVDVKIKASVPIPTTGPTAFGYGIFSDGNDNVVALTSHLGVLDHSSQGGNPLDPVFHAHVLDLAPVTGLGSIMNPCNPAIHDLVVDFASSRGITPVGTPNNIDASYKVKVKDKQIEVKKIPVSPSTGDMNDNTVEAIVAFSITGIGEDPNAPAADIPWLCLDAKP